MNMGYIQVALSYLVEPPIEANVMAEYQWVQIAWHLSPALGVVLQSFCGTFYHDTIGYNSPVLPHCWSAGCLKSMRVTVVVQGEEIPGRRAIVGGCSRDRFRANSW